MIGFSIMEKIYFIKMPMSYRTDQIISNHKNNFEKLLGLDVIISEYNKTIEKNKVLYLPKNNEDIRAEDVRSRSDYIYHLFFDNVFKNVLARNKLKANDFLLINQRRGTYTANGEYNNPNIEFSYIQNVVMMDIKLYKETLKITFVPNDLNSDNFLMIEIDISIDGKILNSIIVDNDYEEKNINFNHKQVDHVIMLAYFSGNDKLGSLDRTLIKAIIEENYDLLENHYSLKMMEYI